MPAAISIQPSVSSITPWSRPTLLRPQLDDGWPDLCRCEDVKMYNRPPLLEEPFAQTLSGKSRVVSHGSRLVLNPLVALWLKGHQKQRPILRRNFPAEVGIFLQYLLSRVLLAVPDAPDGAAALGGLPWSGWPGVGRCFKFVAYI